MMTFNLFRRL